MKTRFALLLVSLVTLSLPGGTAKAAACDPDGKVKFICGMIAPEDLVPVPRTDWVIASGYTAGGAIHLINVRDYTTTQLFPTATPRVKLDAKTYAACPGPLDPAEVGVAAEVLERCVRTSEVLTTFAQCVAGRPSQQ